MASSGASSRISTVSCSATLARPPHNLQAIQQGLNTITAQTPLSANLTPVSQNEIILLLQEIKLEVGQVKSQVTIVQEKLQDLQQNFDSL